LISVHDIIAVSTIEVVSLRVRSCSSVLKLAWIECPELVVTISTVKILLAIRHENTTDDLVISALTVAISIEEIYADIAQVDEVISIFW